MKRYYSLLAVLLPVCGGCVVISKQMDPTSERRSALRSRVLLSGTISDWSGDLILALQSATAVLAVAAVLALFQRDLGALSSQHIK